MSASSELAHLFRALKAPAAARALPKLAERARSEDWSYEQFAERARIVTFLPLMAERFARQRLARGQRLVLVHGERRRQRAGQSGRRVVLAGHDGRQRR